MSKQTASKVHKDAPDEGLRRSLRSAGSSAALVARAAEIDEGSYGNRFDWPIPLRRKGAAEIDEGSYGNRFDWPTPFAALALKLRKSVFLGLAASSHTVEESRNSL
jgi:hypothetical protein